MPKSVTKNVGRPKSEEKRQQILDAAVDLFLSHGVTATSMDAVAKASGVSKQTVYSHFANKDDLYTAAIESKCQEYWLAPEDLGCCDGETDGLKHTLELVGVQLLRLLSDPQVISMFRIVISEAKNAPEVAQLFYQAGPRKSVEDIAHLFHKASKGLLTMDDSISLAIQFLNLLKGDFHIRSLFGLDETLSSMQIKKKVDASVNSIMILYQNKIS
ncbi:TetR/AcrR family transcriptional regulator [Alteromonas ponticola]|uniref:TetR/AcrR family transcriptional regulator n=1 Tax=Alteromonas ponticola TaxID=2720613 RepID=A0ABX1R0N4_9ALTE|nr:TetR/AcrR family transcriptional regulator C-terminal domain-containing protein [Alteromonas ponticola]NMH60019.1 TetR/AcrR family transcriptional regulator [Alteromonas ponticola]